MRKRYILDNSSSKDEYWDLAWRKLSIEGLVKSCDTDPLRPILDNYFPRTGKILEAGCGLGNYVIYYRRKGYDIEGVDFAQETIERILEYDPNIPVQVADVRTLPYSDDYFDAYFSGGVIEHFEEGPYEVLREAHRVLKKEGVLIVVVPYLTIVRQLQDLIKTLVPNKKMSISRLVKHKENYVLVNQHNVDHFQDFDLPFHEYFYQRSEIVQVLQRANFQIIKHKLFSIAWGMKDFRIFRFLLKLAESTTQPPVNSYESSASIERNRGILGMLKKAFVTENSESLLLSGILFVLRHLFSHLIVLICVPSNK